MGSLNKAMLIGRLGRDPETKTTPSGTQVTTFSIATSDRYTDKQGQKQEKTEWHNIVAWSKLAEICSRYLSKGSEVYIEGSIQTRSWDDKDGKKQYRTEINASTVQFLGGKSDGGAPQQTQPQQQSQYQQGPNTPTGQMPTDDLPF